MFKWEKRFSVNVSDIDEEHKYFIYIINKVYAARQHIDESETISEVLNEMTLYALSHFETEEKYMIKFDYPEHQIHREEHQDFLMTTFGFCQRVINGNYKITYDLFEYLKQWMTEHIMETDKKYSKHFNKNGLI